MSVVMLERAAEPGVEDAGAEEGADGDAAGEVVGEGAPGLEAPAALPRSLTATKGSPQRVQRFPLPRMPHLGQMNNSAPHWSQKQLSLSISAWHLGQVSIFKDLLI